MCLPCVYLHMPRAGFLKTSADFSKVEVNDSLRLYSSVLVTYYLGSESFKPSLLESPSNTQLRHHVPSVALMYFGFSPMQMQQRVKDAL